MDTLRTLPPGLAPVRVYVADPRVVLVDRLAVLADQYEDLRLAGAQTSGSSAVASVALSRPSVVLVGDHFPDADGFDICGQVRRAVPSAAVILVSETRSERALLRAVEAGACGVVSPLAPDEELVTAILGAADGELLFSRSAIQRLFVFGRELRLAQGAGCAREKHA